jgi:hypothetical protein
MVLGIVGAVTAGLLTAQSPRARAEGGEAPPFAGAMPIAKSSLPALPLAVAPPLPGASLGATVAPTAVGTAQGAELARRSLDQLALFDSLSAKIRFHGNVLDRTLSGTGLYLQSGHAPIRLRMELKMPVGDDLFTLQQVCDGNALWSRRTLFGAVRLGRVDAARALTAREARLASGGATAGTPTKELALGGLPLLVDGVRRSFDLQTVRSATVGKIRTHKVSGRLNPSLLAELLPEQKETIHSGGTPDLKKLPEQAPTHVDLYIGVDDLFPYKFDFKRVVNDKTDSDDASPMYGVEFYDVERNIAIDPVQFLFQPGELVPVDDTELFIGRQ